MPCQSGDSDFLEYQRDAMRTRGNAYLGQCKFYNCAKDNCSQAHNVDKKLSQLNASALGLAGESGEFVDLVKKVLFHEKPLDYTVLSKLNNELGDVLWYIALAADALDFHLDDIARANIGKLKARYPEGFSPKASEARVDVQSDPVGMAKEYPGFR